MVIDRDRPFMVEHGRSVAGKANAERVPPKGLHQLLAWLAHHWQAEMPEALHGSGPFFGPPGPGLSAEKSRPNELTGGSLLGSPRYSDPFRSYLEGQATQLDGKAGAPDEHGTWPAYQRPVHAAIARMAGRDPESADAMHARFVFTLAVNGFDWQAVAERAGTPWYQAPVYVEWVLRRLWRAFEVRPPARDLA